MKLTLVNDKDILIRDIHGALSKQDDIIELDTQYIKHPELYEFRIKFNSMKMEKIVGNKIVIPESLYKTNDVIIRIEMVKLTDKSVTVFLSDSLPMQHYISLGNYVGDMYPRVIADLQMRIKILERRVNILDNQGDIF